MPDCLDLCVHYYIVSDEVIFVFSIQRAELGYLIDAEDLDSDEPLAADHSSIRYLAQRQSTIEFDTLLRGNISFGALLELYGFSAVPSPMHRGPGAGNLYFRGGYLTRKHGSINTGTIDAIQIESARSFRENSTIGRYAKAVACAVHDYICMHYLPVGGARNKTLTPGCSEEFQSMCSKDPSAGCRLNTSLLWTVLLSVTLLLTLGFNTGD